MERLGRPGQANQPRIRADTRRLIDMVPRDLQLVHSSTCWQDDIDKSSNQSAEGRTLADLSNLARKSLMKLLNLCLEEAEEASPATLTHGFMGRAVPADLNPPADRRWLYLEGESYQLYHESLF